MFANKIPDPSIYFFVANVLIITTDYKKCKNFKCRINDNCNAKEKMPVVPRGGNVSRLSAVQKKALWHTWPQYFWCSQKYRNKAKVRGEKGSRAEMRRPLSVFARNDSPSLSLFLSDSSSSSPSTHSPFWFESAVQA